MNVSRDRLGKSVARGGSITVVVQVIKAGVQFVGLVVLSRLIDPEIFGYFAVVMACFALGEVIRDFGLTSAAVQTESLSHRQASNLFWLSVGIATVLAGTFLVLSPILSSLLAFPLELLPFVCAAFIINGAQAQLQVKLTRENRFAQLALSDLASQISGVATAIFMAFAGFGIWALATQVVMQYVILLISRAIMSRWIPGLPGHSESITHIIRFGLDVGGAQILGYAAGNADMLVIAAKFGATPLGYYSRAFQLLSAPLNQLLSPLTHVLLPTLAAAHRYGALTSLFFRLQWVVLLGGSGFFTAVAVNHEALTVVILGENWGDSSILVAILAVGGALQVATFTCFWIFLAIGASRQLLLYNLLTKVVTVVFVVVGSFAGVTGVAVGYSCGLFFALCVCLLWVPKLLGCEPRRMVLQLVSVSTIVLPAGLVSFLAVAIAPQTSPVGDLFVGLSAYLVVFMAFCMIVPSARRQLMSAVASLNSLRL